jgi:hypothetical protein
MLTLALSSIGGSTTLSVTGDAWWEDGDGVTFYPAGYDAPFSIDQCQALVRTKSNDVFQ